MNWPIRKKKLENFDFHAHPEEKEEP